MSTEFVITFLLWAIIGFLLSLLVVEHVGRRNNMAWIRPSTYMRGLYLFLLPYAAWAGALCTDVLGFLALVDLKEWFQTIEELSVPAYALVFGLSATWFEGMYQRIEQTSSFVVFVISFVLIILIIMVDSNMVSMLLLGCITAAGGVNVMWNWNLPAPAPPFDILDPIDVIEVTAEETTSRGRRTRRKSKEARTRSQTPTRIM
jgi:hypothetical protein